MNNHIENQILSSEFIEALQKKLNELEGIDTSFATCGNCGDTAKCQSHCGARTKK